MARNITQQLYSATAGTSTFDNITIGVVVDTDDPQQMGRVRAVCPALNDSFDDARNSIPWAQYAAPFGGIVTNTSRGPSDDPAVGAVAYGMWNVPKLGAKVLIACVDGNPLIRIWLGCLYETFTTHTMPHGRYTYQNAKNPDGPLSTSNSPIQPLYNNYTKAFRNRSSNFEWRTRGADFAVAAISRQALDFSPAVSHDDQGIEVVEDDKNRKTITQGYKQTRQGQSSELTEVLHRNQRDPQIYSWTTPGLHSIAMDDSQDNCRMRFRTTSGHQIILDDTNERVYISTAKGNNWIEMDENGNIDIYSARRVSVHSENDINFTSDKSIRMHAAQGIHMYSGTEVRMHAVSDINIKTEANLKTHASANISLQSDASTHIKSGGKVQIAAASEMDILTSSTLKISSSADTNLNSGGNMLFTGAQIHLNGPPAAPAGTAPAADEKAAYWTNRVPQHEGWARTVINNPDDNDNHTPQFNYNDPQIGRVEGTDTITRGEFWHR